ncbi:MAG: hypothetical protein HQK53_09550 [Oligoflexia bacterium]|nr:hypothetical protein [Oligoflexia bacterium]
MNFSFFVLFLIFSVVAFISDQNLFAADWSDTSIGDRYGATYREPTIAKDIKKNIVSLKHASGYKYGSNFFNVDLLSSNADDPANGGGGGALGIYLVYQHTFSGKAFGAPFQAGIVRDLGLAAGFDFGAKDDAFSSRVMKFAIGPKISFEVPGFLDLALVYLMEHNHNSFAANFPTTESRAHGSGDVKFSPTLALQLAWGIPFELGLPWKFQGFMNYVGAKGKDGNGVQTKPETLLEAALMLDLGQAIAAHKGTVYLGPQYQYWKNKFGNDSSLDSSGGCIAKVWQASMEVHF